MGAINIIVVLLLSHTLFTQAFEEDFLDQFKKFKIGLLKRSSTAQCMEESRSILLGCAKKFPDAKSEFTVCAQKFLYSFPSCFFPKSGNSGEDCNIGCGKGYGRCLKGSHTFVERVVCVLGRERCQRDCANIQTKRAESALEGLMEQLSTKQQGSREVQSSSRSTNEEESGNRAEGIDKALRSVLLGLRKKKKPNAGQQGEYKRDSCRNTCMGYYDQCLRNTNVNSEGDYTVCLTARTGCEQSCH